MSDLMEEEKRMEGCRTNRLGRRVMIRVMMVFCSESAVLRRVTRL